MPYAPHLRISVRGDFWDGTKAVEEWQFGLNAESPAPNRGALVPDTLASVQEAVTGWWGRNGSGFSGLLRLTQIKVAAIDAAGHYVGDAQVANPTPIPGPHTVIAQYPPQCALVVSLGTGQRGAHKRGRVFLPMPTYALQGDYRLEASAADAVATSFATLVKDLARTRTFSTGSLMAACVASKTGVNTPVSEVHVGRVVDTIRTRRRSLVEAYTAPQSTVTVVG